jgi:hypothetical protein
MASCASIFGSRPVENGGKQLRSVRLEIFPLKSSERLADTEVPAENWYPLSKEIKGMNQISNVPSAIDQQMLATLQVKLLRDSPPENGQVKQVSSDYLALQVALRSGNAAEAETDFVRLQHDTQAANPGATTLESSAGKTQPPSEQNVADSRTKPLLNALA